MSLLKKSLHRLLRIALWVVFILLLAFAVILGFSHEPVGALVALAGAVFEGLVLRFVVYPKQKP